MYCQSYAVLQNLRKIFHALLIFLWLETGQVHGFCRPTKSWWVFKLKYILYLFIHSVLLLEKTSFINIILTDIEVHSTLKFTDISPALFLLYLFRSEEFLFEPWQIINPDTVLFTRYSNWRKEINYFITHIMLEKTLLTITSGAQIRKCQANKD